MLFKHSHLYFALGERALYKWLGMIISLKFNCWTHPAADSRCATLVTTTTTNTTSTSTTITTITAVTTTTLTTTIITTSIYLFRFVSRMLVYFCCKCIPVSQSWWCFSVLCFLKIKIVKASEMSNFGAQHFEVEHDFGLTKHVYQHCWQQGATTTITTTTTRRCNNCVAVVACLFLFSA